MAAPRFLRNVAGIVTEIIASVVSAANAIVATDSTGRIDISMMPVGVGAETVVCVSSENLATGALVNLYLNGGVITARNADNTNSSKPAHGFVLAATTSPASATVYALGQNNTQVSGLTIGTVYFLGTVGALVTAAPSTSGNLSQEVGIAVTATELDTYSRSPIVIA